MNIISMARSGGQTGVDIASLRAAKSRGVPTGGVMPAGFRTLDGPRPEWAREFGLSEHASEHYPPRTFQNVRDSDLTIRIAATFESGGERLTRTAIERYGRPFSDVWVRRDGRCMVADPNDIRAAVCKIREVAAALERPVVANFAGNSERTAPGIELAAEEFVRRILDAVML